MIMNKQLTQCEYCNIDFYSRVVNDKIHQRFCSRVCKGKAQPPTKQCYDATNTTEERERRRERMMGEKNPMWCGGDSDKERRNSKYKYWRIAVFKRDNFTCKNCGYRNGDGTKRKDLHAHHIVKWIDSIELRYEVDNGKTLCVPCHINEHTNKH